MPLSFRLACGRFGGDGTINHILDQNKPTTLALRYTIDGVAVAISELNSAAQKLDAHTHANRLCCVSQSVTKLAFSEKANIQRIAN